jgi:hypothetical protein
VPFIIALLAFLCAFVAPHSLSAAAPERGTAILDPQVLRDLDAERFGLGQILDPAHAAPPITNDALFAMPAMAELRKAIDGEYDRYVARHRAGRTSETIGVGASNHVQLFDRALLYSSRSRFVLGGIVNRMDRAFLSPITCGEIRLIYRLVRIENREAGEGMGFSRLPMTLSVVLKARGDRAGNSNAVGCADIARRWLDTVDLHVSEPGFAAKLLSQDGPLVLIDSENIDRIETNLQIAHARKSAIRDFRTDYLLKQFHYDAQTRSFEEGPLDNQIDRERILSDANLAREFRAWLLDPAHLSELDRGTVAIPDKFLSLGAVAATPAGFAPSTLQPAFGLVQPDATPGAVLKQGDVIGALKQAADRGIVLKNIRSVDGFERRLNDVTCSGCHQTRGIGGFHFTGVDWLSPKTSNAVSVAASPHFFGDQPRRRDILTAIRDGKQPDYSRGFSDRPQVRGSTELAGTGYDDGWGATCYRRKPRDADNDMSFRLWTCAEGLSCQAVDKTSRIGMCFVESQ